MQALDAEAPDVCKARARCEAAGEPWRTRVRWQYALNNLVMALRDAQGERAPPPGGLRTRLVEAAAALAVLDSAPGDEAAQGAAADVFRGLLEEFGPYLRSLPATRLSFAGSFRSVRIPVEGAGAVGAGQVLLPLRSGGTMPLLGFGTQCLSASEAEGSTLAALEAGYRRLDVAPGREAAVGRALTAFFGGDWRPRRGEVFITVRAALGAGPGLEDEDIIKTRLRAQLRALGVAYADLYLVPGRDGGVAEGEWAASEALVESGAARALGAANVTGRQLEALLLAARVAPAAVLNAHSVLTPGPGSRDEGEKDAVEQVAFPRSVAALAEGVLSGGAGATWAPLQDSHVRHMAGRLGRSPAQVLLRWAMQRGMAVLPCSRAAEHIEENADVFGFELGDFEMAMLTNLGSLAETYHQYD